MCNFFSIVTKPDTRPNERFYFNWERRVDRNHADCDSHSIICKEYNLSEDKCNKFEYNPLTGELKVDQINNEIDDRVQVGGWCESLNFKKIVQPLIIKPIINPFEIEAGEVTDEVMEKLKEWDSVWAPVWDSVWVSVKASVWASVGASVWASVRASVGASVGDSVWASVWDSVWASVKASVKASVGDSVRAYISSFFDIQYSHDLSSATWLWERGFVPSFYGTAWRLHAGKDAKIVYEMKRKHATETD